jgi:hypothetical protein
MKPTRKRLVTVAAALSTVAIAVPASTATAAPTARAVTSGPFAASLGGVIDLPFTDPVLGQGVAVIGPTVLTTAPSTFINTNNQISTDGNWSGGQFGP